MLAPFEWHRALTLEERLSVSRAAGTVARHASPQPAVQLLRALDGLSPETLRAYRAPDIAMLNQLSASPALLGELEAAMPWLSEFRSRYDEAVADALPAFAPEEFALVDALRPITTSAIAEVANFIRRSFRRRSPALLDGDALLAQASHALHERSFIAVSRALVVELGAAQATGLLQGDTPAERFVFFVECLREPAFAQSLMSQYPVLVRQVVTMTLDWRDAVIEFLERFCRDRDALIDQLLDGRDPGALAQVTLSAGDSHRHGRAVIVAAFADGWKVVYKPRSLRADRHFSELVEWMNARDRRLGLGTVTIIDRGEYGWSAFVEPRPCASEDEIKTFYRKQGANLALVHLLCGADLHSENVIAAGDTPYLIDMEALFHPVFLPATARGARRAAQLWLGQSVLRTGLLPVRSGEAGPAGDVLDLSGMGNADERLIPFDVPMWDDANTDEMRIVYGKQPMKPDSNLPCCNGRRFGPEAFVQEIVDGFTAAYRVMLEHREQLAHPDGPIHRFRGDSIRIIVRATARYSVMLLESFHPDCLADAIDKERFFDGLWDEAADNPLLARLARAERRDLWRSDVPVFTSRTDCTTVWTSDGECIDGALTTSGLVAALARVADLGERDLAQQVHLIHAALASAEHQTGAAPRWTPRGTGKTAEPIRLAVEIGETLADSAFRDGGRATWLVLRETASGHVASVPAGPDLYSGLSGIVLFLAALATVTREGRFADLALSAMRELLDDPALTRPDQIPLGAFDGLAGVIYSLAHSAHVLSEPRALSEAERLAAVMAARMVDLDELDVVSGSAGIVPATLAAAEVSGRPIFAQLARKAGDALLRRIGDVIAGNETGRLARQSFGHGAAGIAFALLRLNQSSRETAFKDGAIAILHEELSGVTDGMATQAGWCRGEPGVALTYAAAASCGISVPMHAIADRIANQVQFARAPISDCLCHGTMGNLLVLQDLQKHRAGAPVERDNLLVTQILQRIARDGALCGTQGGLATPGLMDGLAGIGLGLLRLASRTAVPNVLVLGGTQAARTT